jgi:hypothetical protein
MLVTGNVVIALLLILRFHSGKGKTAPVCSMKVCGGGGGMFPPTFNFDTRCMYVVSVTPWPLYPEE